MTQPTLTRRRAIALGASALACPAVAKTKFEEIQWEDLIPPGVPYSEIIGEGDMDVANDTWSPIYDANGTKLNAALDGRRIKMPGYIVPFDMSAAGITDFILAPYLGACIHVPPPPANQLVLVSANAPWPADKMWEAVWVTGLLRIQLQSTELGQTGYVITNADLELYQW